MGSRFRMARKAARLTQEQVAQGLCDRSYISLLEQDKVSPPTDLLVQLSQRVQIPIGELLGTQDFSTQTRSQLLYLDDLMNKGQIMVAYEYLEHLWWDAIHVHDKRTIHEIYRRVQRILEVCSQKDLSWPNAMVMWFLNEGDQERAIQLGYHIQRTLFRQQKWGDTIRWGKALLEMSVPLDLRLRIGIATGSALLRQGDVKQSEYQYTDVLNRLNGTSQRLVAEAWVTHGLSAVYGYLNEWEQAQQYAQRASTLYQTMNSPMYWLALQNVGISMAALGKPTPALQILMQCREHWIQMNDTIRRIDVEHDIEQI
nr:helix-turn-helix transcriptional regulator [Sulfobacillus thermosulfidooxidans]